MPVAPIIPSSPRPRPCLCVRRIQGADSPRQSRGSVSAACEEAPPGAPQGRAATRPEQGPMPDTGAHSRGWGAGVMGPVHYPGGCLLGYRSAASAGCFLVRPRRRPGVRIFTGPPAPRSVACFCEQSLASPRARADPETAPSPHGEAVARKPSPPVAGGSAGRARGAAVWVAECGHGERDTVRGRRERLGGIYRRLSFRTVPGCASAAAGGRRRFRCACALSAVQPGILGYRRR